MAKKKHRAKRAAKAATKQSRAATKNGPVWHRSAEEATLDKMPKFNGHACGTGAHGDTKYNRCRQKRAWRKELGREAHSRGPLVLPSPDALTLL